MESLDKILSERGEAVTQTQEQPSNQTAGTEQATQSEQTEGQQQEGQEGQQKTVPLDALHAEKQKSKRYTEEVASLRQEIAQRDQAWERRISQLVDAQKPPQQQPDWWENPTAATEAAIQKQLQQHVGPLVQQQQQLYETMSRRFAVQEHGQEAVETAYEAMSTKVATDPAVQAAYQQIMNSGDPWGGLVRWHKRESFLAEAGTDPEAYKQKLKQELLTEIQQNGNGAAQTNGQQKPAMPSNLAGARNVGTRSGPAWGGPPSLNDIFNRKRQPQS